MWVDSVNHKYVSGKLNSLRFLTFYPTHFMTIQRKAFFLIKKKMYKAEVIVSGRVCMVKDL